jgi:hypothetical protein
LDELQPLQGQIAPAYQAAVLLLSCCCRLSFKGSWRSCNSCQGHQRRSRRWQQYGRNCSSTALARVPGGSGGDADHRCLNEWMKTWGSCSVFKVPVIVILCCNQPAGSLRHTMSCARNKFYDHQGLEGYLDVLLRTMVDVSCYCQQVGTGLKTGGGGHEQLSSVNHAELTADDGEGPFCYVGLRYITCSTQQRVGTQ